TISPFWLKISFVFILIGFGTKMGLAPLHFWLPDAHSEAPAPISALLSGALLNIALIPILRVDKLMRQSGMGDLVQELYLLMGILSVFIAAVFVLRTKDYKRLLAYSSIENMGLIMIAFGCGGVAYYAGLLHILGHSLIKAAFFLTAGNALEIYKDKNYENTSGLLQINRGTAWLWLISSAMIIGLPPSPLFTSKFLIATALLGNGYYLYFGLLMLLLAVISWAIFNVGLRICLGESERKKSLSVRLYLAPAGLLLFAALIGIFLPALN
ncbi:MAG: proton-conducting transporter membrane subunit, partial [Candidatus Cloacimonetes bacterium]|nr:proton-conducting transporter membrane subunit [Candidatus Cloacimonadota bacterium]